MIRYVVGAGMDEGRAAPGLGLDGVSPEEAFAILGDETRLNIIRVLWETGAHHVYDDVDDGAATISFSELRRRVDVDDNGRFNYHLSKLVPHFVRRTEEGYRLSGGGKRVARTVATIAGAPDAEVGGEVGTDCPACGAAVVATYEEQWLRFACTECPGLFGDVAPAGTLLNAPFPPSGVAGRTATAVLATELYRCLLDLTSMVRGICPECASPVRGSLSVCEDHDAGPDRLCEACRTPFATWGDLRCDTCRFAKRLPVELCVLGLGPVIGFLYARDTDVFGLSLAELFDLVRTGVTATVTGPPLRVVATVEADDVLTLTLDEQLSVLEVSR
jgi:hypothetical protein